MLCFSTTRNSKNFKFTQVDVVRTFHHQKAYKQEMFVLIVFCAYPPEIIDSQGMVFVVAFPFPIVDEDNAFSLFAKIGQIFYLKIITQIT
jgi:hypothetical protein